MAKKNTRTSTRSTDAPRSRRDDEGDEQDEQDEESTSPPVREEYPGPQKSSTGERIDPGDTGARPRTSDEKSGGRRRGTS